MTIQTLGWRLAVTINGCGCANRAQCEIITKNTGLYIDRFISDTFITDGHRSRRVAFGHYSTDPRQPSAHGRRLHSKTVPAAFGVLPMWRTRAFQSELPKACRCLHSETWKTSWWHLTLCRAVSVSVPVPVSVLAVTPDFLETDK